jgi:dynein heavy chain
LRQALSSITWKSADIAGYIKNTGDIVGQLANIQKVTKNNLEQIQRIMKKWSSAPLIERKDNRKLLNLEEKDSKVRKALNSCS